jgi:hypothetical protein
VQGLTAKYVNNNNSEHATKHYRRLYQEQKTSTKHDLMLGEYMNDIERQEVNLVVNANKMLKVKIDAITCDFSCPITNPRDPKEPKPKSSKSSSSSNSGKGGKKNKGRYWSDKKTWPNKKVPKDGDNVVITEDMVVFLDVDTAKLGYLQVHGRLYVNETTKKNQKSITLDAERIWVSGQFHVGSHHKKYQSNFKIYLRGDRQSPSVLISQSLDLSNKVLAVTGDLIMHGKQTVSKYSTRLSATASSGATVIEVVADSNNGGWKVGDEVLILPTSRTASESEIKTISAISADGKSITLENALSYAHYGDSAGVTKSTAYGDLDMRAEVVHISRNIHIEASRDDKWGGRVVIAEYFSKKEAKRYRGKAHLDGVSMTYLGQASTDLAGLTFENLETPHTHRHSKVENCVIRNSYGWNAKIKRSRGVHILNNVFVGSYVHNLRVTGSHNVDIVIEGNFFVDAKASSSGFILSQVYDFAAVYIDTTMSGASSFKDNTIAGCGRTCLNAHSRHGSSVVFRNNVAHSGRFGWVTDSPSGHSNVIENFIGYKLEIGIVQYDNTRAVHVKKVVLSDCKDAVVVNTGSYHYNDKSAITLK